MVAEKIRYKGSHYTYDEVATRGDEFLGVSFLYHKHFTQDGTVGAFVIRFNARSTSGQFGQFNKLANRNDNSNTEFAVVDVAGVKTGEKFHGLRLTKACMFVFTPAPRRASLIFTGDKLNAWEPIAQWVIAVAEGEGFTLAVSKEDIVQLIRQEALNETFKGEIPAVLPEPVEDSYRAKLTISFPDLDAFNKAQQEPATFGNIGDTDSGDDGGEELEDDYDDEIIN